MARPREDPIARFWAKVDRKSDDDCWEWVAGKYPAGYGIFWLDGHHIGAHVFSYLLAYGAIEKGLWACHTCDNPGCVNPGHLFPGTPKDNTQDMIRKGRKRKGVPNPRRGENHYAAKLTDVQVAEIRGSYRKGQRGSGVPALAKKYNVAPNNIYSIVNYITRRIQQ